MRRITLLALPFFALAALTACGGEEGGGGEHRIDLGMWTPSGNNQTDTVGHLLPKVIRVRVLVDSVPTAGFTVTFAGGNVGTTSVVTNDLGQATTTWTLGPLAGTQFVTASLDGAHGSPVIFHATAVTGTPAALEARAGDGQIVQISSNFGTQIRVRTKDALGNPVGNVWVYWSKTGSVNLGSDSIITGDNGEAVLNVSAGASAGPATITATAPGLAGSPLDFHATVVQQIANVDVANTAYTPSNTVIAAGSAVKWTWTSGSHSVTSNGSPSFVGTSTEVAGFTFGPLIFDTPGVYAFHCTVHGAMTGTITVN